MILQVVHLTLRAGYRKYTCILLLESLTAAVRRIAAGRNGRIPGQRAIIAETVAVDHNSNREEVKALDHKAIQMDAPLSLKKTAMSVNDQVTKSEIIWTLKIVDSNFSYNSSEDLVTILKCMDPRKCP